jgi:TrmH family RNA methyltransferase
MTADPFSPKAVQASTGSLLSLWIRRTPAYLDCLKQLRSAGYHVVATSAKGTSTLSVSFSKCIVALGNEGNGLTNEVLSVADQHLRIPINNVKAESLNVAVCGAIIMHYVALGRE